MLLSKVLGVIVIARNGDRYNYYQDPLTYAGSNTETTALGEVQSHSLGSLIRSTYFDSSSPSYIEGIRSDLVDNNEVKVRVKAGVEGTVVFDSAIALLQGLFPPNPNNKIVLANETTIVAPLGGYQYVPVETVEPGNDRSLESWTNCPNFEKHTKAVYGSDDFKTKSQEASSFFNAVRDYVFGRPTTLQNAIYDFINSELTHNKTYAHRLPPTFLEQARHWANYHEHSVFSDNDIAGIGNIAGRTLLHTVLESLERIAFNGDPLQFMLVETTYQPFLSLFQQTGITKDRPDLSGFPDYASALAIELRRGSPPDVRDFLRIRFKNGTSHGFEDVHVFGHNADIPFTEFVYRAEGGAITSNKQWMEVCGIKSPSMDILSVPAFSDHAFTYVVACIALGGLLFSAALAVKKRRAEKRRLRLLGSEVSQVVFADYGSVVYSTRNQRDIPISTLNDSFGEHSFAGVDYYPENPVWIL
ncbi:hypothetical protein JR316_0002677 [Psilocybe cubensis]|uniref:Uncharacterized protein n=1 Tax=Psilocybe cubensis TaxID=181762 RepID=A0ACB8HDI0_PSICU|nr:hypothetical protein JR316_0002677 [Psilocybe cubensis]KAH9485762.1 hypothetical protein JR316_0002677 [Psilocybe cubensis]